MRAKTRRAKVNEAVRAESGSGRKLSLAVHALAEPAFKEVESSRILAEYLAGKGFAVDFPFRRIPTAFRAIWGKGKPVVGMLAEYDALPNCGAEDGQWGHGCGHNLLGVAPAVGAVAAARVMDAAELRGSIVYYGCPAEETLAGKVYMARDGAF
jgi:aminobenzoyl-glutamate utilization protein B